MSADTHLYPGVEALSPGAFEVFLGHEEDLIQRARFQRSELLFGLALCGLRPQLHTTTIRVSFSADMVV